MDTAANPSQGASAVRDLMKKGGISDTNELSKDKDIYDAVLEFLEQTGFAPPLRPPHKY